MKEDKILRVVGTEVWDTTTEREVPPCGVFPVVREADDGQLLSALGEALLEMRSAHELQARAEMAMKKVLEESDDTKRMLEEVLKDAAEMKHRCERAEAACLVWEERARSGELVPSAAVASAVARAEAAEGALLELRAKLLGESLPQQYMVCAGDWIADVNRRTAELLASKDTANDARRLAEERARALERELAAVRGEGEADLAFASKELERAQSQIGRIETQVQNLREDLERTALERDGLRETVKMLEGDQRRDASDGVRLDVRLADVERRLCAIEARRPPVGASKCS